MADTIQIGNWSKLQRQPNVTMSDTADSVSTVLTFRGDYNECVRLAPSRGDTIIGLPGVVSAIQIEKGELNTGTLTITVSTSASQSSEAGSFVVSESHELRHMEITKELAQHPRYSNNNKGFPDGVAQYTFSDDCEHPDYAGATIGEIAKLCAESDPKESKTISDKITTLEKKNMVVEYATLIRKGVTSYKVFVPVLHTRTTHVARPTGAGAGWIVSSRPTSHPLYASVANRSNLTWFKDSDDIQYNGPNGGYTRSQSWIGLDEGVETKLYRIV